MDFPTYNFDDLNEADVREEIVAPLLRSLGYRSGTINNIIREQTLNYPKTFLGRKKGTDPILRGRADYICDAQQIVRWTIEAKSPAADLDRDAEEQSWTYANHPEIRAVYFCLTNGKEFKIFQTNRGPEAEPVFQCKYENLRERLDIIKNILVPEVLLRDYPRREIDTHPSLGPGLRSIVRITHGEIVLTKNTLDLRPFVGLTMTITDGSVERNEDNQLEAYIETLVPFQSLQRLNEKLGLHVLRLKSAASSLSVDAANPTEFNSTTTHILPQGEMALNPLTWQEAPFPMNMRVETYTSATGYLDHHIFRGKFNAVLSYPEIRLTLGLEGTFRLHVS